MGQLEGMVTRYFLVLILALLVMMLSIFSLSLVQTDELQTIKTQEGKKLIISEKILINISKRDFFNLCNIFFIEIYSILICHTTYIIDYNLLLICIIL